MAAVAFGEGRQPPFIRPLIAAGSRSHKAMRFVTESSMTQSAITSPSPAIRTR